jgi:hypothetical protein
MKSVSSSSAFHIYGWGTNSRTGSGSGVLRTGRDGDRIFVDGAWSHHFTAQARDARICKGDSGGPATDGVYGPVVGIASSVDLGGKWKKCPKKNWEMVWSRVYPKIDWISANLNSSISRIGNNAYLYERSGYVLYRDGVMVGWEPSWSQSDAIANCQYNKLVYSGKVECFYNDARLGYELYRNGSRDGFEPTYTYVQAIQNCEWNRSTYPTWLVECLYHGFAL